jgi:predicted SAM-dependent methyltransferase
MQNKRLILGPGKHWPKQENDCFCDIRPFEGVDVVHDLNIYPWPFNDRQFIHVSAVHVVEHLDSLLDFMNECHRVLIPGGSLYIETPLAGADPDLQFCDPTHIRCYRLHTFANYFTPEGIERFGYTDKAWAPVKLAVENNCIIFHGYPIKNQ